MKLSKKNITTFILFLFIAFVVGSLAWELFERILTYFDIYISMVTPPVGFDLSVITFSVRVNPGSLIGIGAGVYFFKNL